MLNAGGRLVVGGENGTKNRPIESEDKIRKRKERGRIVKVRKNWSDLREWKKWYIYQDRGGEKIKPYIFDLK